jgi:autotransporter-associated beta strand protein
MAFFSWSRWLRSLTRPQVRPLQKQRQATRLLVEQLEHRLAPSATTFVWTGAANTPFWNNGANWLGGVAPTGTGNEDLVFGNSGATNLNTNNNIATPVGLSMPRFNSITFAFSNYTLGGSPLELGGPQAISAATGELNDNDGALNEKIQLAVELGGTGTTQQQIVSVGLSASLTFTKTISTDPLEPSMPGWTKVGVGPLTLSGSNTFTEPFTVAAGVVKVVNPNALGVSGTGTYSTTTVQQNAAVQLIGSGGVGGMTIPNNFVLSGFGQVNDGALLNVQGNNFVTGSITLDNNVFLGASNDPSSGLPTKLTITGQIGDLGAGFGISKEGPGQIVLDPINADGTPAANTYRGQTVIDNGILTVQQPQALGNSPTWQNQVIVNTSLVGAGTLQLDNELGARTNGVAPGMFIANELLTINGKGFVDPVTGIQLGALQNFNGNNTWSDTVTLNSVPPTGGSAPYFPILRVEDGTNLLISGVIQDAISVATGTAPPASLTKTGAGTLILTSANTYLGFTNITEGVVNIEDSQALGPADISDTTNVASGAALELELQSDNLLGMIAPAMQAQGQGNAALDSITGTRNRLELHEVLTLHGTGIGAPPGGVGTGALHSISGINTWDAANPITIAGTVAIGVEADPNEAYTFHYLTTEYSLNVTGAISGGNLLKVDAGDLVLTGQNTYTGYTDIIGGWITVESNFNTVSHNGPLGHQNPLVPQTQQPYTTVEPGAALMLKPAIPGTFLSLPYNLHISGLGLAHHNYAMISSGGALENLDGTNLWTGIIQLQSTAGVGAGIGVEQAFPLGGADVALSQLTTNYQIWNSIPVTAPSSGFTSAEGGFTKLGSQRFVIQGPGTYTGANDIHLGAVLLQNSNGLGAGDYGTLVAPPGGLATQNPDAITTVDAGATLELANSINAQNGGLAGGLSVWGEKLILNGIGDENVAAVAVINAGLGYQSAPTVTLSAPQIGTDTATAHAVLSPDGQVAEIVLDHRGSGYTSAPTVTLTGGGFVAPATAVASVPFGDLGPITVLTSASAVTGPFNDPVFATDNLWAGPVSLQSSSNIDVQTNGRLVFTGTIDDDLNPAGAGINLVNAGEVDLFGANTYHGLTQILKGVMSVGSSQALGAVGTPSVQIITINNSTPNSTSLNLSFGSGLGSSLGSPVTLTGIASQDALNLQNALNSLSTIANKSLSNPSSPPADVAGNAIVSSIGPGAFQVILSGSLLGFNQPLINASIAGGSGTVSTAYALDANGNPEIGTGGAIISSGAMLQLDGSVTLPGKPLEVIGTGNPNGPNVPSQWFPVGPAPIVNGQTSGSANALGNTTTLPVTGRVTGIVSDPRDPNIIYIATAGGGVWKTIDGGNSWHPVFDSVPAIQTLTMSAPTGTTSGTTFTLTFTGPNLSGTSVGNVTVPITYDSTNPNAVAAAIQAALNDPIQMTNLGGVGGLVTVTQTTRIVGGTTTTVFTITFQAALAGQAVATLTASTPNVTVNVLESGYTPQFGLQVGAITMDPVNSNVLYIGTGEANNSSDSYYGTGVYMTQDGGVTWTLLLDMSNALPQNPFWRKGINAIATDPANPANVATHTPGIIFVADGDGSPAGPTNDIQSIGTGTITFTGPDITGKVVTDTVSIFGTLAQIEAQLDSLSNIGGVGGYVIVTPGGPNGLHVEFAGALAGKTQNLMTVNGAILPGERVTAAGAAGAGNGGAGPVQVVNGTAGQAASSGAFLESFAGVWRFLSAPSGDTWFCMTDKVSSARASLAGTQGAPPGTPGPDDDFRITFPYSADPYATNANGGNAVIDNLANWTDVKVVDTGVAVDGSTGGATTVVYAALGSAGAQNAQANAVYRCEDPLLDAPVWYIGDPGNPKDQIDSFTLNNPGGSGGSFDLILPGLPDTFGGKGEPFPQDYNPATWTQPITGFNTGPPVDLSGKITGFLDGLPYISSKAGAGVAVSLQRNSATQQIYYVTFIGTLSQSPQPLVAVGDPTSQFSAVDWGVVQTGGGVDTENTYGVEFPSVTNSNNVDGLYDPHPYGFRPPTNGGDGNIKITVIPNPAFNVINNVTIYASVSSESGNLIGVYVSNNTLSDSDNNPNPLGTPGGGGHAWALTPAQPADYLNGQGNYSNSIVALDAAHVYVGGSVAGATAMNSQIYFTGNGGAGWSDVSVEGGFGPHTSQHALFVAPTSNPIPFSYPANQPYTLYAGDDGGIYALDSGFNGWHSINGAPNISNNLAISQVNSIAPIPTSVTTFLGGIQSNGTAIFNNSQTWSMVDDTQLPGSTDTGLMGGAQVFIDSKNPLNMYAVQTALGGNAVLRRSTDGGVTWSTIVKGFSPSIYAVLGQIDPQRLVVSAGNVPLGDPSGLNNTGSTNQANTGILIETTDASDPTPGWIDLSTYLPNAVYPDGTPAPFTGNITAIALSQYQGSFVQDPSFPDIVDQGANTYDKNTIYITNGSQIWVTKDHGVKWVNITPPTTTPFSRITQLVVDPTNRDTLYVVSNTFNSDGAAGDGAAVSGKIFLYSDATNSVDNISLTYKGGGWLTVAGPGPNGFSVQGMPDVPVETLVVDPRTGNLFAGTDIGVYWLPNANGTIGTFGPITQLLNNTTPTETWQPFGIGMPKVHVDTLLLNQTTNTLLASTHGRGVFELFLNTQQTATNPVQAALQALSGSSEWTGPVVLVGDPATGNTVVMGADGNPSVQSPVSTAQLNLLGVVSDLTLNSNPSLVKNGLGSIELSGQNVYGGTTTIQTGAIIVNNLTALGGTTNGTTVQAGAALLLESSVDAEPLTLFGDGPGTGFNGHNTGALESIANSNTYQGTIHLRPGGANGSEVTIGVDSQSTLTITGQITDDGLNVSLTKELTGLLVLDEGVGNTNSYTGTTFVDEGALQLASSFATTNTSNTVVLDGAQLQLHYDPNNSNQPITGFGKLSLSGTGINNTGALVDGNPQTGDAGGSNTWTGSITLDSIASFAPITEPLGAVAIGVLNIGDVLTINGVITDESTAIGNVASGLIVNGGGNLGTVVLTQADSYTGTTYIKSGVLKMQNAQALGGAAANNQVQNATQRLVISDPSYVSTTIPPSATGTFTLTLNGNIIGPLPTTIPATGGVGPAGSMQNAIAALLGASPNDIGVTRLVVPLRNPILGASGSTANPHHPPFEFIFTIVFQGALSTTPIGLIFAQGLGGATALMSKVADGGVGALVQSGATLALDLSNAPSQTVSGVALQLNGTGTNGNGALENVSGNNTWEGPTSPLLPRVPAITLNSNGTTIQNDAIGVDAGTTLTIQSDVNNPATPGLAGLTTASLHKVGAGTLVLPTSNAFVNGSGNLVDALSFEGTTFIDNGIIQVANANSLGTPNANEVQTLTITGSINGSFTLTYTDAQGVLHTSQAIPRNWSDTTVSGTQNLMQVALNNLLTPLYGPGATKVTQLLNSAGLPTNVFTITFLKGMGGVRQAKLLPDVANLATIPVVETIQGGLGGTTVNPGGTLQLLGSIDYSGAALFPQGYVTGEVLTLNGNGFDQGNGPIGALDSVPTGGGSNIWDNPIVLGSNAAIGIEFDPAAGVPGLIIDQSISEAVPGANLTILGPSVAIDSVEFTGPTSNTYTGLTTVVSGTLLLNKPVSQSILTASESGTTVTITTTQPVGAVVGDSITITGVGTAGYNGTFVVTGVNGNSFTYINRFTNLPADNAGGGTAGFPNIPGNLQIGVIGNNLLAIAELMANGQFKSTATVTVNTPAGLFDGNGFTTTIATLATNDGVATTGNGGKLILVGSTALNMTGGLLDLAQGGTVLLEGNAQGQSSAIGPGVISNSGGGGTFSLFGSTRTFTMSQGPAPEDMDIRMPITGPSPTSILVTGVNGRLELDADSTATLGPITVTQGASLQVDGQGKVGTVMLANGGTVSGTGQVGNITGVGGATPAGSIDPGDNGAANPAGVLTSNPNGTETWGGSTFLTLELNNTSNSHPNPIVGSDYDQLIVNGSLNLGGVGSGARNGGAILNPLGSIGAGVQIGDTFTIIQTVGGTITGRFSEPFGELANGNGIAFISGVKFLVIYNSTSVVLQRVLETTTLSLASNAAGNTSVYGQDVIFTASLVAEAGAGKVPTSDTVTFTLSQGSTVLQTKTVNVDANGNATYDPQQFVTYSPATFTVTAAFNPDPNFTTPPPATLSWTVNPDPTSLSLTVDTKNAVYGQTIVLTAKAIPQAPGDMTNGAVKPSSPTPNVTFKVNGNTLSPLGSFDASGQVQYLYQIPALGTFVIQASYAGDPNYLGSNSPVSPPLVVTATKDNSSVTLVANPTSPDLVGQTVTFTARITTNAPGTATPPNAPPFDSVVFTDTYNGSTVTLGSSPVQFVFDQAAGQSFYEATVSTATLGLGTHSIKASYSGDSLINASSATIPYVINQILTTTTLSATPTPDAILNQQITLTANVTPNGAVGPASGVISGTVNFYDGSVTPPKLLGVAAVSSNGQAQFTISTLAIGTHNLYAVYTGNTNYAASGNSNTIAETIFYGDTVTVTSSLNPAIYGQVEVFTANVAPVSGTPAFAGIPQGTVDFYDGNTLLRQAVQLDANGNASFSTALLGAPLTIGTHNIIVKYNNSSNKFINASGSVNELIESGTTTALTTSAQPNPAGLGLPLTLTATVVPINPGTGVPSGTVTFEDGSTTLGTASVNLVTGQATFTTSTLGFGFHQLTAIYGGGVTGTITYAGSTSNTVSQQVIYADTTALTSSLNPAPLGGSVTFSAKVTANANTPAGINPTGTVTFMDGQTVLTTVGLNASFIATYSTSTLSAGTHNITAVYNGNTNFISTTSNVVNEAVLNLTTTSVSSSKSPIVYSEALSFTVTVMPAVAGQPTPTGTVTVFDGATAIGSGTLNGGQAIVTPTTPLNAGSHSITAVYSTSANYYTSTSQAITQIVNQDGTTTSVASSSNVVGGFPTSVYSEPVILTAQVASVAPGTAIPSGTVTFFDNSSPIGTAQVNTTNGQAKLTTTVLTVGSHIITASFGSTQNFTGSTSSSITQHVNVDNTTTTLAVFSSPSVYGQQVTLQATIAAAFPGVGIPQGTVAFFDGPTQIGTVSVNASGQAILNTTSLFVGTHSLTATFGATSSFNGSSSSAQTQIVTAAQTSTTVTLLNATAVYSQPVSIEATVAPVSPGGGVPQGGVTFYDNGAQIGTASLDGNGVGTISVNTLSVGTHAITATYGTTTNYGGSTSSSQTQTINPDNTSTTLTSSSNQVGGVPTSVYSESVTLTATITAAAPGTGIPNGTVAFFDGTTQLGTSTVNGSGQATLTTTTLPVGSNSLTAVYTPATPANYNTSTSAALTQQVNQSTTSISLTSTANPAVYSQLVTFVAVVSVPSPGTTVPAGSVVSILDNGTQIGTATIAYNSVANDYEADFPTTTLTIGTHKITAQLATSTNYQGSTSNQVSEVVNVAPTTITLSSNTTPTGANSYASVFGQSVTFSALVSAAPGTAVPMGTVTFMDGTTVIGTAGVNLTTSKATFSTSSLILGTHSITASYSPLNSNFLGSNGGPLTQQVNADGTVVSISSSANPSTVGALVTLTASVTPASPGSGLPAGTVTFVDSTTGVTLASNVVLSGGKATIKTSNLAFGPNSIIATYNSTNANFTGNTGTITQSVFYASKTSVVSSLNPAVAGTNITFTATVAAGVGAPVGSATPTGQVNFYDGQVLIGTGTIVSGKATFTTAALAAGTHSITAQYQGDHSFYGPSTSIAVSQGIDAQPASIQLVYVAPKNTGQYFTVTAYLYDSSGNRITTNHMKATIKEIAGPAAGFASKTVSFANGKFTFANVRVTKSGAYTLEVDVAGLAATLSFNVKGRLA